jgi:hypothetical protein
VYSPFEPVVLSQITVARLPPSSVSGVHRRGEINLQNSAPVSGPLYDLLLVVHIVAGVVGFGALAAAGWAASSARGARDPAAEETVRRFFKPGRNWPARAIFLVPLLGLALLFGGDRDAAHSPWPWIGLALWLVVAGLASGMCWPAEAQAQQILIELLESGPTDDLLGQFRDACRRMETAAWAISACFVAAVLVMILQP